MTLSHRPPDTAALSRADPVYSICHLLGIRLGRARRPRRRRDPPTAIDEYLFSSESSADKPDRN
jgi:hypothetical protein